MTDRQTIEKICSYANLTKHDTVLEIGAGTGNLTDKISESSKFVYAIENDPDLVRILKNRFKNSRNIKIIPGNALRIEFPRFNKIVSNLPYNISRRITEKILGYDFWLGILVYQKEFAEKLIALPGTGNYRFITAFARSNADIEILDTVPPSVFSPIPNVESAIVRIKPFLKADKKNFQRKFLCPISDKVANSGEDYSKFLHLLFDQRNKKVSNVINAEIPEVYGNRRPFELSPEELKNLYTWFILTKSK